MHRPALPAKSPCRVVHQNGFDQRPVGKEVERLFGHAAVGDLDLVLDDRVHAERLVQTGSDRGGQSQQLAGVMRVGAPDCVPNLSDSVGRLVLGGQPLLQLVVREAAQTGAGIRAFAGLSGVAGIPRLAARRARRGGLLRKRDGIGAGVYAGLVGWAHRLGIIACRPGGWLRVPWTERWARSGGWPRWHLAGGRQRSSEGHAPLGQPPASRPNPRPVHDGGAHARYWSNSPGVTVGT